jgi:hypothetical protein
MRFETLENLFAGADEIKANLNLRARDIRILALRYFLILKL